MGGTRDGEALALDVHNAVVSPTEGKQKPIHWLTKGVPLVSSSQKRIRHHFSDIYEGFFLIFQAWGEGEEKPCHVLGTK